VLTEAAVLAGAFTRQGPLSPMLLMAGALIIYWLYCVIQRDWQLRDRIGTRLEEVTTGYGFEVLPAPPPGTFRGRTIVTKITLSLILANVALAMLKTLEIMCPVWTGSLQLLLK